MTQRITSGISAPVRSSPSPARQPTTEDVSVSRGWAVGARKNVAESPLDRWHRLREPVLTPVKVHTAVVTDEAKRFAHDSGLTAREGQDLIDELNGIGLADPMWPHFKSMGFHENEAGELRQALRDAATHQRTSISSSIGTQGVAKHAVMVEQLSSVVEALTSGGNATEQLAKLTGPQGDLLRRAPADDRLPRAMMLLETELSHFLTDNPADLVDAAPAAAKRGLLAMVAAETKQLSTAGAATRRKMKADGYSSIALLRELTVLDPTAARVAGARFADALHASR